MLTIDQLSAEATRAAGDDVLVIFASPAAPGDEARRIRRDNLFAFGQGQKCFAFGVAGNPACLGDENTAGGFESMGKVTGAPGDGRNTAYGSGSAHELTTGTINTFVGYNCGYWHTTGIGNTGLGAGTLGMMASGSFNTALGSAAMENMDMLGGRQSSHNVAVGYGAMYLIGGWGANYCTCVGREAGAYIEDSVGHTLLGYFAGGQVFGMTGSYNTLVGYQATIEAANTAHAVALGDQAIGRSGCFTLSPSIIRAYIPYVVSNKNAEPDISFLANGEYTGWLDPTPGATAFKILAKDSSGNVRRASIAMA